MSLPWYPIDTDFITSTSKLLARRLNRPRREVMGIVLDLIPYVIDRTSTDDRPPDGVFVGPDAVMELEAGAEWDGPLGQLAEAMIAVGMVERLELGVRFKGTDRYKETWAKRTRDRNRLREIRSSGKKSPRRRDDIATTSRDVVCQEVEVEEEVDRSTATTVDAEPSAPPAKDPASQKPRPTSAAVEFVDWTAQRRVALDPRFPADPVPKKLWPRIAEVVKETGLARLKDAYLQYLSDQWALSRDPPCPIAGFVADGKLAECLSRAARRGPEPPPEPICTEPGCTRPAYDRIANVVLLCIQHYGGWQAEWDAVGNPGNFNSWLTEQRAPPTEAAG